MSAFFFWSITVVLYESGGFQIFELSILLCAGIAIFAAVTSLAGVVLREMAAGDAPKLLATGAWARSFQGTFESGRPVVRRTPSVVLPIV